MEAEYRLWAGLVYFYLYKAEMFKPDSQKQYTLLMAGNTEKDSLINLLILWVCTQTLLIKILTNILAINKNTY